MQPYEMQRWAEWMGQDLTLSPAQPLQPVRVRKDGTVKLSKKTLAAIGAEPGRRVAFTVRGGRCHVEVGGGNGPVVERGKPFLVPASPPTAGAVAPKGADGAALLLDSDGPVVLPVFVTGHAADVLGPRFCDEVSDGRIVRHAVPGVSADGWSPEALGALVDLSCAEPFQVDPVAAIAEGDDWVAWMTRNRVLNQPASSDDDLRGQLVREVLANQRPDGSWGGVPTTAYAILRLLDVGEPASAEPIRRAAAWLLDRPEPPPRPGMWMLTQEYHDEWMARRKPAGHRQLAPGQTQRGGPGRGSFYSWEYPVGEQDLFRSEEAQRAIPICARHHSPACEPRMTHVSGVVAEALLRCGLGDHPRLRRWAHMAHHVGGEWGYWCGCGGLGLADADITACEDPPDLNVRGGFEDGRRDMSPWRWLTGPRRAAALANQPSGPKLGTDLMPFGWRELPGAKNWFALVGNAWQNGDCWAKTNRALAAHPDAPGSVCERLAIFQASRYQNSLGEWDRGFSAGFLALLAGYTHRAAEALVTKNVPWLRAHQCDDGLWHHQQLYRQEWGQLAEPGSPRLVTYHIVASLARFGLLARLRPTPVGAT